MAPLKRLTRLKRAVRRAVLLTLVLGAVTGSMFYLSLDRIARHAVEEQTTQALNLRTTVKSVAVHPLASAVGFNDFRIASPAGFEAPDILVIPWAEMDIECIELRNEPVHIKSVIMARPRLVIEGDGIALNLTRMVERIPPAMHPVHLVIDQVTVRDATVVLRNLPGIPGEVTIPVQTFAVNGLGVDRAGGISIKDGVISLVTSLAVHASVSPQMPADYRALMNGDIGQIVRSAIPAQVAGVLSVLLGRHNPAHPASGGKGTIGLFGMGGLFGTGGLIGRAQSRPAQ